MAHRPRTGSNRAAVTALERLAALLALVICFSPPPPAQGATPVVVQDFEQVSSPLTVWVVNIPNENATVQVTTEQSHAGLHCLKLHYHFVATGGFQYLGIPNKVRLQAPVHRLRFWLRGDSSRCSYGVQMSDAHGETHQYSPNTGQGGMVDFAGWREIVIDLDSRHETWGGDKNGRLDYPITAITFTVGQPKENDKLVAAEGDLAFDSLSVDSEKSAEETLGGLVSVVSPGYGSDVRGNTPLRLAAPGFKSLTVKCWKPGGGFGSDSTVGTVALDAAGQGSVVFPAEAYPHGPVTVRISGERGGVRDNCYLQLYNQGGVSWNEGTPKDPPPAAQGMGLVFADDFNKPPAISSTDPNAAYYDHKPPGGWQDFSTIRFTSFDQTNNPFHQVDSYLRIRASERAKSTGLICSMKNNAQGITARAPCYFECRFLGPNAIGTWPAFWVMTDYMSAHVKGIKVPCDELDIIEAYGGEGPHAPNAFDTYMICPHAWEQGAAGKAIEKKAYDALHNPTRMGQFGIPSTWFETFHTYACKITETDTIYYCDNLEVGRHETLPLSRHEPFFFLINLATGGGWPVDLSPYDGLADMYIDYVRVYSAAAAAGTKRVGP